MATYVLVHGGWHGGWCWARVAALLRNAGHEVWTPTLTGLGERAHLLTPKTSLSTHVQDLLNVLFYEDLQQVVLVGHSYAGMVITAAAEQVALRIARLVYLDAFVPVDGQAAFDLLDTETASLLQAQAEAQGEGWRIPPPPLNRYGVNDPEDLQWATPRLSPHPLACFREPIRVQNIQAQALPRTYIACTIDQRPAFVATVARLRGIKGWQLREVQAGHDAMVTAPQQVAELLLEAAGNSDS